MHNFTPSSVFDRLYKDIITRCECALNSYGVVELVKHRFVAIATYNFEHGLDIAQLHQERVQACRPDPGYCNFCIVQPPANALECQHRLCDSCIVALGMEISHWHYWLGKCPLCQMVHEAVFAIKPSTAGNRVLVLGGEDTERTWQFLKNLERTVGLKMVDIRGLFDEVRACGTGIFFALAIFLEGWDLYDCKHHVTRIRSKKFRRGTVMFGSKLKWNLDEIQRCNDSTIVIDTGKSAWSNRRTSDIHKTDLLVQYEGGTFDNSFLETISSQILSSLFYIELDTMPDALLSSQYCAVMLHCRIPPGQPLVDLLYRLRRAKTSCYYQYFGVNEIREDLCSDAIVWDCERGRPFMRTLIFHISSIEDDIRIAIDGLDGRKHWISHCPYKIKHIIRDQEIDNVFGKRDKKHVNGNWKEAAHAEKELRETLNNV
ncbi:unnamed protein product [Fusarium graminearum]|nr:unnamed protein product [Fusarium graminearum]